MGGGGVETLTAALATPYGSGHTVHNAVATGAGRTYITTIESVCLSICLSVCLCVCMYVTE